MYRTGQSEDGAGWGLKDRLRVHGTSHAGCETGMISKLAKLPWPQHLPFLSKITPLIKNTNYILYVDVSTFGSTAVTGKTGT
jgi:hypothetical protein